MIILLLQAFLLPLSLILIVNLDQRLLRVIGATPNTVVVRPIHVVNSLDIWTVLDEHDLALSGIRASLAGRVLGGRRVVHVTELLAQLLISCLGGAVVDHCRGACVILMIGILHLVKLLHLGAVLLLAA